MQTIDLFDTLFHQLRIKYTYNNLYTQVTFTPYINSMYGIGLILAKYNIDHKCIKLTQKDKILYRYNNFSRSICLSSMFC